MNNRRKAERQPVSVVLEVDGKEKEERVGITRDASTGGLLIGSPSRFKVGEILTVTFDSDSKKVKAKCRVVRCDANKDASSELWRNLLAVTFLDPVPDIEKLLG